MKKEKATVQNEPKFDFLTIKTFEDACVKTEYNPSVAHLPLLPSEFSKPMIAVLKLMIIFKAINDGWTPDWSNTNQAKWFPWFRVLPSGSGFSVSYSGAYCENSSVGSRLCTDTEDKCRYIKEQFEAEYKEFFLYS